MTIGELMQGIARQHVGLNKGTTMQKHPEHRRGWGGLPWEKDMRGIFDTDQETDRDGMLEDAPRRPAPTAAAIRHEADRQFLAATTWAAAGEAHPIWDFRRARCVWGVAGYAYTVAFVCGCMAEQDRPRGEWAPLPWFGCEWHNHLANGDS